MNHNTDHIIVLKNNSKTIFPYEGNQNSLMELLPEKVPSLPVWTEKYYMVKLPESTEQKDLFLKVVSSLSDQKIFMEILPQSYRLNCELYSDSGEEYIPFVVRIYKCESVRNSRLFLEFQRRHGDTVTFVNMFNSTLKALGLENRPVCSLYTNLQETKLTPEQVTETMDNLSEHLATTEYYDCKEELLKAITLLCYHENYRQVIGIKKTIRLLVSQIKEDWESINRCVICSLLHLSSDSDSLNNIKAENITDIIKNVEKTAYTRFLKQKCKQLILKIET